MKSILNTELRHASVAMGFMTRLGPSRLFSPEEMAYSLRHFTLVGIIIGMLAAVPVHVIFGGTYGAVQAWIWVGLSVWLTRGLHWDGWADLWDAWGSCAQNERFWAIMKDSHIGAFGVIGLVLGISGQILTGSVLLESDAWPAMLWAPAFGRAAAAAIAALGEAPPTSTLGRLFLAGATPRVVAVQALSAIILGIVFCGMQTVVYSLLVLAPGMIAFVRLSRRQGGINGDFLGATIIWGELAAMLGAVAALGAAG